MTSQMVGVGENAPYIGGVGMTRGHSVDLRERVVRQIEAGGSVRTVAAIFAVSAGFRAV